MDPKTYCLRRTAIAAVRTSIGEKTFWQDFDGQIRETRYEYGKGYSGGDAGSIIAGAKDTKYQGPLAAFSTKDPANAVSLISITLFSDLSPKPSLHNLRKEMAIPSH